MTLVHATHTLDSRGGSHVGCLGSGPGARGPLPYALLAGAVALAACVPSLPGSDGCRVALLPGELVITEVFADFKASAGSAGIDAGKEWFEIYNAGDRPIALDGLTITHSRADGSRANLHAVTGGMIAPGELFTLGNAEPELVPPYVDHGYGADLGDLFNSEGGMLALSCGGDEIDRATYDGVREGHSRQLTAEQPPDHIVNDQAGRWCQAGGAEFEDGNFGTPGAGNDCRPLVAGRCDDGGAMRDAVPPGPGDLVITEVMPSPGVASDAAGEWFEVQALRDVDLNGVGLDRLGDTRKPDLLTGAGCLRLRAGARAVLARSTSPDTNGGIATTSIAGTFGFALVAGSAATPGDVAIVAGGTVIDAVRWTRTTAGKALQLDPDLVDPITNDTESNFCDAAVAYNAPSVGTPDLGTPGAANSQCALLPPAGRCDDGGAIRAIVKPPPGALVISELLIDPANVVVGGEPSLDAQREWFEIANTSTAPFDLNELTVRRIGGTAAPVRAARCLSIAPRGFAVLARSAEPALNSMLPAVAATFRIGLVDQHGDLQIADGATVLDEVRWTSAISGVTRQLDPRRMTPTDNDAAASFCAGTNPYGDASNQGSPGAVNTPCP
jgi:hypothetical protein